MDVLSYLRANRLKVALVCGGLLLLLGGAGALGAWLHPRTVTVTEYKDRVQVVEHTVTVEKPVVQWRDRVVTRTVYKDGKVESTTTAETKSGSTTGGKETTTDVTATKETAERVAVTVSPEGRWSVRVLAGANSLGGVVAGAGVEYRAVGPLTLGAWATAPVAGASSGITVGLSLGLRL